MAGVRCNAGPRCPFDELRGTSALQATLPCHSNGRLACDDNGKIIAAEFDFGLDHGAYSWGGDDCFTKQARFAFFPYTIPNVAGLCRVANTNHNFGTAYRSYGSPQAYTLSEALMDMLAERAGIDPFEFCWRNIDVPAIRTSTAIPSASTRWKR